MNAFKQSKLLTAGAVILALGFTGCSSVNNDVEALSDEDISLAAEILGQSVSDNSSGVLSSMYDAVSDIGTAGISYGDAALFKSADPRNDDGRGRERNFSYSYDPETGIHSMSYERSVVRDEFSKSVSVNQQHIFTTLTGRFIQFPRANRDSIETIDFIGNKSGESSSPRRENAFSRIDTMNIDGLHSSSSSIVFNGTHNGSGSASAVLRDGSEVSRDYEVNLEYIDVAIEKDSVVAYGNLEQGVTGTFNYSMVMNRIVDGEPEETVVEGTIELVGDGTALLEFRQVRRTFRIFLDEGEVEENS
ncbi:MAG: hypothetical protein AAFW89_06900 [Bacteroidota bacterium]